MNEEKIKTYDECNADEKEVIDNFRKMKLLYDHARYKLHQRNFEDLIDGELDATIWGITREHETETWNSELRLMTDIKTNFDIALHMIESGEAEQVIIESENFIP